RARETLRGTCAPHRGRARRRLQPRDAVAARERSARRFRPGKRDSRLSRPSAACGRESLQSLPARGDAELAQEALHVRANGVLGDEEALCDLVGRQIPAAQPDHPDPPPTARPGNGTPPPAPAPPPPPHPPHHPPRHPPTHPPPP